MPSHFSTIGFPVNDESDFLALANRVANDCDAVNVPGGRYLRWASDCGAEIWLQLDRTHNLIGMVPHFAGESSVRVGITSRIARPDDTAMDGAFHGWADPPGEDPETGVYPLVFDAPDYCRHGALTIPSIVPVQLAAFAHEISVFDSPDAYNASQAGEFKLASQSFIPSGLFSPDGEPTEPPQAYGIFSGHILQTAKKRNPLTGHSFYWALVDSLGGVFDVVIDPALMGHEPEVGGVLTGSFWLSGCLATQAS